MSINNKGVKNVLAAARDGDLQIIKEFIDAKKDLNVQGPDGRTLLINAAANRHGEIVKLLINSGVDLNRTTNSKKTVLNYVLCSAFAFDIGGKRGHSSVLEIVKMLLSHHCNVLAFDIASAVLFQSPEVISTLLKRVSQNKKILVEAIDYVDRNAFEYGTDESTVEKNLDLVRVCLKRI